LFAIRKTQTRAQAAGSGSSRRVRSSMKASASAAPTTASAEITFARTTDPRGSAPKRRYSDGSISRMALYSKNQVHRGHPQRAKGRLSSRLIPRKMPASSSVRRRVLAARSGGSPRARAPGRTWSTPPPTRPRPPGAGDRPPEPETQGQGEDAEEVPVQGAVDEQRRRRSPDPRLGPGSAAMNQSVKRAHAARSAKVSAKYPAAPAHRAGEPHRKAEEHRILDLVSMYGSGWRRAPRSSWRARMSEYASARTTRAGIPGRGMPGALGGPQVAGQQDRRADQRGSGESPQRRAPVERRTHQTGVTDRRLGVSGRSRWAAASRRFTISARSRSPARWRPPPARPRACRCRCPTCTRREAAARRPRARSRASPGSC